MVALKVGDRVLVSEDAWGHGGAFGRVADLMNGCANVDLEYCFKQDEWFKTGVLIKIGERA